MKSTVLRVADAKPKDAGHGIARIDPDVVEELGLVSGDIIMIKGTKDTVAKSWRGYPEDSGTGSIRLDSAIRRNAGVGIDEKVTIQKIDAKNAARVKFAPTEALRLVGGEEFLSNYLEGHAVSKGDKITLNVMGRKIDLIVINFKPAAQAVIIDRMTKIQISDKPAKGVEKVPQVSYEDIGGLDLEIKKVREMIELPLRHPELFEKIGVEAPKGVLLHGPPGTGKTLLAKAVAHETNAHFINISGPEIMSKFYGESEANIREVFKEAEDNAPAIIFIDEIDSIAPKRDETQGEVERRVVAQILALMDGLEARGKVVVIGATNRVNALDPALRRGGRFDREIEIGIPDRAGRLEILQIHTRGMPLGDDVDLQKLANVTHGYSGADIAAMSKEAAMLSLRNVLPEIDLEADMIPMEVLNRIRVTMDHFEAAVREVEPSTLREVVIENPNVHWEEIGGLDEVKQELQEAIEWPLKYEKLFRHMNAQDVKGILLYGPPGTGKTLLAKAVATESEVNFISVKGPEFLSKWVGESEKAVRETFRKARQAAPCIIFFDEIDAVAPTRGASADSHVTERVISQILTELDGMVRMHNIRVIAATNRPDMLDSALLRTGRFDRLIYIPPPDEKSRFEIFKVHTKDKPLAKDVDLEAMAKKTENYTGADIAGVCNEATMLAIREAVMKKKGKKLTEDEIRKTRVHKRHFEQALTKVRPMRESELVAYQEVAKRFRGGRVDDGAKEEDKMRPYQ
jgi:transitional endoplasmic reticulum ATPase